MRGLGLIPKVNDALHGFSPEEINLHFSNVSFSTNEDPYVSLDIIHNTPLDRFWFKEVSNNDVILAVSHFKYQAKEEDGKLYKVLLQRHCQQLLRTLLNFSMPHFHKVFFLKIGKNRKLQRLKKYLSHPLHLIFVLSHYCAFCQRSSRSLFMIR